MSIPTSVQAHIYGSTMPRQKNNKELRKTIVALCQSKKGYKVITKLFSSTVSHPELGIVQGDGFCALCLDYDNELTRLTKTPID